MSQIVIKVEGLEELTQAIKTLTELTGGKDVNAKSAKKEKDVTPTDKAEYKVEVKGPETTEESEYTMEDVRVKLVALSKGGKKAEVKAMLTELGVKQLSDLDESLYPKAMEMADELENGGK